MLLVVNALCKDGNEDDDESRGRERVLGQSSCDNISTTSALNAKLDMNTIFDNKKMKIRAFGNRTVNVSKT